MYSGSGFSDWEIGDITVLIHDGVYHLFHLIIPNHDYIAHAISHDGISWQRVNNALFVGHPGSWDDDMLWTMHVVEEKDGFIMYYTGLQRKDRGGISRVGIARSQNLIDWTKTDKENYPIEPKGIYYETSQTNPRTWLSFRDPFRFDYKGESYLLVATRTLSGPVSRRGCVGMVNITNDTVMLMPPLLHPMMYDDIECPCIFQLGGRFYLLGSIREDIRVRYWYADDFFGAYRSFNSDLLLPKGNYAARTVADGEHLLVYNFFYAYGKIDALRVMPPPKELDVHASGKLILKSYYRWNEMAIKTIMQRNFNHITRVLQNNSSACAVDGDGFTCSSVSGYEIFMMEKPSPSFIWEGLLTVDGQGKFGLVCDLDPNGNGYFISFNPENGVVRIRSWGFNADNTRQNFIFNDIQSALFDAHSIPNVYFRLIRYGNYIEFSIDGEVKLSLMDYTFSGNGIGFYTASESLELKNSFIKTLPNPGNEYASQEETQKAAE